MDPDDIDTAEVAEHVTLQARKIMQLAADKDSTHITECLHETNLKHGGFGLYGIAVAIAEYIRITCYPFVPRGDGTLDGAMMVVLPVKPNAEQDYPNTMWAARFVVAYINGDSDTCGALFANELNNEEMGGMAELIASVGHIVRERQ